MKHEDFLQQYVAILQQEDRVLNEALRNLADKEYHWYADFPYVTAELSNCQGHLDAKVMAAKYPVTPHSGSLSCPTRIMSTMRWVTTTYSLETSTAYWMHCQREKSKF